MKFYIISPGDPEVGIPEAQSTVEVAIDEHNEDWVQATKEQLQEAFSEIFDDVRTYVLTQEDMDREVWVP